MRIISRFGFLWASVGVVLVMVVHEGDSQEKQRKQIDPVLNPELSSFRNDLKKDIQESDLKMVPMDSPVDPAEYVVGPSDVLGINIWSSPPVVHKLTITPEATVLVPDVGSVDVLNLTLDSAKSKIIEQVRKRYVSGEISVTLLTPRKVRVQIEGNALYEQMYEMYATQRVDNLIEVANNPPEGLPVPRDYENDVADVRRTASSRNIVLRRRTGTTRRVDLVRYGVKRDGFFNPYLEEGDIVYVPWKNEMGGEIGIYGGSIRTGSFEFVPGDSLTDLLLMGYGMRATADSEHIRFSRLSPDGSAMEAMVVNGAALLNGDLPNIALRPGDRVMVPEPEDQRQNYRVRIEGQVVQPGQYPIAKQGTKLSSVIKGAGGFSADANVAGSVVYRFAGRQTEKELEKEKLLGVRSGTVPGDSTDYLLETEFRLDGEIVSVDFYKLFVERDSTQDVDVLPYDRIIVPKLKGTVYVFGQVLSPGHMPFVEGKDYDYYVEKAGGFADEAREGDVRIVKGITRASLFPDETEIQDGDFIWVPRERYHPFSYYVTPYAQLASIAAVIFTAVLVVRTF